MNIHSVKDFGTVKSRLLLGLLSCAAWLEPAFAMEGWSIAQNARGGTLLHGPLTLYITPNGMRAIEPKNGINLTCQGPSWTVYIYNEKTKRLFSSPMNSWLQSFKSRNLGGHFEGANWRRGRASGAVAGARAYEFVMDHSPAQHASSSIAKGKSAHSSVLQSTSLWVASDIKAPPEVSSLLSNLYGVPDCQRIPLRVIVRESGRRPALPVDTLRIAKMNIPDSAFSVPRGYVTAKTDTEVFVDKTSADSINELLNNLDLSTPRKRSH